MSEKNELRNLIRQTVREVLEEMTATGDVAGFMTPFAFTGGTAKGEAKRKKLSTNSTGFMVVDDYEDEEDKADTRNVEERDKPHTEPLEDRKKKIKVGNRKSLEEALSQKEIDEKIKVILTGVARKIITPERAKDAITKLQNQRSLTEGKYHQWRNDASLNPRQKIGRSIREVNELLSKIEESITMSHRLKEEAGVQTSDYWKRTNTALLKIENKLVRITNKLKQVR